MLWWTTGKNWGILSEVIYVNLLIVINSGIVAGFSLEL